MIGNPPAGNGHAICNRNAAVCLQSQTACIPAHPARAGIIPQNIQRDIDGIRVNQHRTGNTIYRRRRQAAPGKFNSRYSGKLNKPTITRCAGISGNARACLQHREILCHDIDITAIRICPLTRSGDICPVSRDDRPICCDRDGACILASRPINRNSASDRDIIFSCNINPRQSRRHIDNACLAVCIQIHQLINSDAGGCTCTHRPFNIHCASSKPRLIHSINLATHLNHARARNRHAIIQHLLYSRGRNHLRAGKHLLHEILRWR